MTAGPLGPDELPDTLGGDTDLSVARQLSRLDHGLRILNDRIDEHADGVTEAIQELATEIDTLRDELDGHDNRGGHGHDGNDPGRHGDAAGRDVSDPPPVPHRWAARATRQDWDALVAWVDGMLNAYSVHSGYAVPPCWPAHPGVVEQLAALYRAWISAVLTDEEAGVQGSVATAAWHDRWLWPALHRFKTPSYLISNCGGSRHVPETGAAVPPTDQSYLPPTSAMAASGNARSAPADAR